MKLEQLLVWGLLLMSMKSYAGERYYLSAEYEIPQIGGDINHVCLLFQLVWNKVEISSSSIVVLLVKQLE